MSFLIGPHKSKLNELGLSSNAMASLGKTISNNNPESARNQGDYERDTIKRKVKTHFEDIPINENMNEDEKKLLDVNKYFAIYSNYKQFFNFKQKR